MATREILFPAQPVVSAGGRVIASPFQFVTRGDDHLRVVSANSVAGVELRIAGRRYSEKGEVLPLDYRHTPNTDRSTKTENFALGAGAILNLTVSVSSGAPLVGQTFVILQLIQGLASSAIVIGTILSGYVTATQPRAFPGSPIEASTDGPGALRFITGTNPAAGAQFLETVPTGARWELLSVSASITFDATVVNRAVRLNLDNGSGSIYAQSVQKVQPVANQGWVMTWSPGFPIETQLSNLITAGAAGLPVPCPMLAGHRFYTDAVNFQAGDNWAAPLYIVREWLEV